MRRASELQNTALKTQYDSSLNFNEIILKKMSVYYLNTCLLIVCLGNF